MAKDKSDVVAVPAASEPTAPAAHADVPAVPAAKRQYHVMFRPAEWQPKDNSTRRLAEADVLGAFDGPIALTGFVVVKAATGVVVYLPSASRVGSAKAIAPARQLRRDAETGETFWTDSKAGEAAVSQLQSAILSAYRTAELLSVGPFDRMIALDI